MTFNKGDMVVRTDEALVVGDVVHCFLPNRQPVQVDAANLSLLFDLGAVPLPAEVAAEPVVDVAPAKKGSTPPPLPADLP